MRRRLRILRSIFFSIGIVSLAAADDAAPVPAPVDEEVVVTATRLDDRGASREDQPAHVTVIDRAAIEASGARTIQDLLSSEAGINLYDQVGNDVQKTLDLRGFTGGKGIAVFLDGARINDPRNNAVGFEQVPLEAIERIEITRGSAAALAGGGSEAGVVRIVTRRGGARSAAVTAAGGTWGTANVDASYGDAFGKFDLLLAGTYDTTDGFRENAGGDQNRWSATGGYDLGGDRRLSLSLEGSHLDYGNPGALTVQEFESAPYQNTFNVLDFSDVRGRQAALNFRGPVATGWTVAANLAYREDLAKTLSTGRAAPVFGGFFLDSDGSLWSATAQATRSWGLPHGGNQLSFGFEGGDGSTDATGFFTSPATPGTWDPSAPSTRNTAGATSGAAFVQDAWTITPRWIVTGGARADHTRADYEDTLLAGGPTGATTFSELSFRAGGTFKPSSSVDVYASYADAFLPPTPEQLFAFPGFGSNPDLKPEDARTYETGARWHGSRGTLDAALFWTETKDEIVFDPTPTPTAPFGLNVNAGQTRRRGVEIAARGRLARHVSAYGTATWIDAAFTSGPNDGKSVPLVPELRATAGIEAGLPAGFRVRAQAVHASDQVLDNDPTNAAEKLPAYTVVDLRAGWERALPHRPGASRGRIGLFVEARNVFDEVYATRGIFAFDFQSATNATFVTPAPGRRYLAGVTWRM